MKRSFSLITIVRPTRHSILCLVLGILAVHAPRTAMAQVSYSTPYSFSTLAAKTELGKAGGSAGALPFSSPRGLAVDAAGTVYVANTRNHTICRITPAGVATILAGRAGCPGSVDGTGAAVRFRYPHGLALDGAGNLYVADAGNNTIRRVTPGGVVTTVAGIAGHSGSADGVAATASFDYPNSLAVDGAGNVYVADQCNATIRKITPEGAVTTLAGKAGSCGSADGRGGAARFNFPTGIAADSAGNVYVADFCNNAIREVTPDGAVTTLAGRLTYSVGGLDGAGDAAQFYHPCGVAVDRADNVYVADTSNHTIRRVTPTGAVTTLAGVAGEAGHADGTGATARFEHPFCLALDGAGNLYVAELGDSAVRKGSPARPPSAPLLRPPGLGFSFTSR